MAGSTRKEKEIFGLGPGLSKADAVITGSQLPTSMQVLRCLMYHLREEPSQAAQPSKWDATQLVYEQVAQFYNKASIPMVPIRKACEKMINLVEENNKLRAIPKNRRQSASTLKKLEDAKKMLSKALQLWPKDVEHLLNSEDCKFLQSMKTDRKATYLEEKIASSASTPASQFSTRAALASESESCEDSQDETDSTVKYYEQDKQSTTTRERGKAKGTDLFLSKKIFTSPKVAALSTGMKLTPTQQAAFTKALIEEEGGDSSKVGISYATADRGRRAMNTKLAEEGKAVWKKPDLLSLHWDSKLL
ncbi:hypothetical protein CAPTEDRAFT_197441 [Capitella teleta]|uniref:Uncharacterized protein n=1 Tax=Capitella teleta TaxID=283909 RepID=R7TH38_CAPTE|nr:hypothetical protein CAPTEDRAFT_197441 [Capitella teleta]|eukprot:ELT90425.1 hypothetical protein CAPTEDRAFT_197441 [Capitella teleta]